MNAAIATKNGKSMMSEMATASGRCEYEYITHPYEKHVIIDLCTIIYLMYGFAGNVKLE